MHDSVFSIVKAAFKRFGEESLPSAALTFYPTNFLHRWTLSFSSGFKLYQKI